MVPNTFEAVAIGNASREGFAYVAGYVDKIKRKSDDAFVAMSEAAGVANGSDGVLMAGARYVFADGTEIAGERSLKAALQYTDQRSVGTDLIGAFETDLLSAKVECSAGEDAWMIGGNYDFQRLGHGELSMFANMVNGATPDSGPSASADEIEYDLTVDYRIREGPAKNLWLRLRAAFVDQDETEGGDDILDFRLIVNWDFGAR